MSGWKALKRIWAMAADVKKQRGGSRLYYFFDGIYCGYRHGASPENYKVLRFYEKKEAERETYLTSGRSAKADRELNRNMTLEDGKIMAEKSRFYSHFQGLVKRKYLYVPTSEVEEFHHFLDGEQWIIVKPNRGIMGHGIKKICVKEISDREVFYRECIEKKCLVEECIQQHEILERISPGCVSTVRINAARDKSGRIHLIGGCLKCGRAGAVTDNFHSSGVAYPVNLEEGFLLGPGRNNRDIKDFHCHPGTEISMVGLQIPYWEEICKTAIEAMEKVPRVGYVGWDIAVTPEGCELIEGNCRWPGGNIIQLDGVGKYPMILKCLEE